MQILVTSDGKYRPCSKHQDYITHNGKVLNARKDTLEEAWNSDYMKEMRQYFIEDKQFPGCSECWRMQKMGLRSMRFDSYQYNISEEQVQNPIKPKRIELNASNVCNLRCRICYPNASSKWIKEGKDLYGEREYIHKNLEGENWKQILNWADNLDEICFFGGEPLLSDENLALMDYLIEKNYAKNISLLFNTNGTIFNDDISKKLLQFKKVRMYFSIDDLFERYEFQRSGAKWDEVEENIRKAYAVSLTSKGKKVLDFKICTTVSLLNIYYFPEFFAYFSKNFPGLKIFWNLIFDPWRLNIQILPKEIKNIIKDRLENQLEVTFKMSPSDTRTIDELVTYLENEVENKPFSEFFRYVNRHDVYRNESYPEVFPEFWNLIKVYQPEDLQMGKYDIKDATRIDILSHVNQYKNLNQIENIRKTIRTSDEWYEKMDYLEANQLMYKALFEVAEANEKQDIFEENFTLVLIKLNELEYLSKNFAQEMLVSGALRIFDELMDLEDRNWVIRLMRKYPRKMIGI
ncbi:MAG: twitch domain-containing radical SAM protein [Chitinophagales bacterium]|nr:twitch domain-containing radical SAM protein [Chitinophagales bacterium]